MFVEPSATQRFSWATPSRRQPGTSAHSQDGLSTNTNKWAGACATSSTKSSIYMSKVRWYSNEDALVHLLQISPLVEHSQLGETLMLIAVEQVA